MVAVGRFVQQLCHGTGVRSPEFCVRFKRKPRPQYESPLPCARMRQRQVGVGAFLPVKVDDVQIERARRPMVGAHATMRGFDALQTGQQFGGRKPGIHGHDRIAEFRSTFRHAPCVGPIERRHPRHLRGGKPINAPNGVTQGGGHIALIASHGDDGMMHLPMFRRPLTRWTVNCFTGTFHGHADIVERHGDRRIRLMHGDLRAAHGGKAENHADDTIGQLFNQIDVFAFDDGHDAFGDRTIVDGVVQIVGTAGGSEVEEQRGVHHEGLGPLMLEVEHAMFARRADSRQSNLIHTSLPLPFLRSVFLLFPRLRCCDYLRFARSRVRILAPCVADGDRVAAFRHVMHAHGPHAMFRAQGADGRGGVVF